MRLHYCFVAVVGLACVATTATPMPPTSATPTVIRVPVDIDRPVLLAQRDARGAGGRSSMGTCSDSGGAPSPNSDSENAKFRIDFDSWLDDNLHWTAPSSLTICSGGRVVLNIEHAANMQRLGTITDSGQLNCIGVEVFFYRHPACEGQPFHQSGEIRFVCIAYKKEISRRRFVRSQPELESAVRQASCVRVDRTWQPAITRN
jgi:hypothetical protein